MSSKEKAKELYLKMSSHPYDNAKQCALVAVDEIIKELWVDDSYVRDENNSAFIWLKTSIRYWEDVKQEIEKL